MSDWAEGAVTGGTAGMSFGPIGGVIGSVIGGISSLLGGKKASKSASDQALMNYMAQKEFAQNSIRWKVEDAKQAGLHPLYALGGSGASFSPNPIVASDSGIEAAGQNLGRAAAAAVTPSERVERDAALQALRAKAMNDFSQAAYWDSQRARTIQEMAAAKPIPGVGSMEQVFPVYEHHGQPGVVEVGPIGDAKLVAPEQHTRQKGNPNVISGNHARFMEAEVTPGVHILMPHQGGQFQEDMNITDLFPWVNANVQKYGWNEFLSRWALGSKGGVLPALRRDAIEMFQSIFGR